MGTACHAIQPTLKEIDGVMRFTFDKQFMLDLNVELTIQAQGVPAVSSSVVSPVVLDEAGSSRESTQSKTKEKTTSDKDKLKVMIPCLVKKGHYLGAMYEDFVDVMSVRII